MKQCLQFNAKDLSNKLKSYFSKVLGPIKNSEKEKTINKFSEGVFNFINQYDVQNADIRRDVADLILQELTILYSTLRNLGMQDAKEYFDDVVDKVNDKLSAIQPEDSDIKEYAKLKEIDYNEVDTADTGGLPNLPVSTSLQEAFHGFPSLESQFNQQVKIDLSNTIIDFDFVGTKKDGTKRYGNIIENDKDLNIYFCRIKNRYFTWLTTYLNKKLGTKYPTLLFTYDTKTKQYELNPEVDFDEIMSKAYQHFSYSTLSAINTVYQHYYNNDSELLPVKAFNAYMLFSDNNLDYLIRTQVGEKIGSYLDIDILAGSKNSKYYFINKNKESKNFGDDRYTDGKEKAGTVSKLLIASTPLLKHNSTIESRTNEYLNYELFFKSLKKIKQIDSDKQIVLNLLGNLSEENPTKQLIQFLEILFTKNDQGNFHKDRDLFIKELNLSSQDLDVFYSIFKRFYDRKTNNSLINIEAYKIRNTQTLEKWLYIDAISNLILRIDLASYAIMKKDGTIGTVSTGNQLSNILNLVNKIEANITNNPEFVYNTINTYQVKRNTLDSSVTFNINDPEVNSKNKNVKILLSGQKQGEKVKKGGDNYINENYFQPVPINVIEKIYIRHDESEYNELTQKQKNYLELLQFIQNITNIQFLGKDILVLDHLTKNLTQQQFLQHVEDLFILGGEILNVMSLYNEFNNDSEETSFINFLSKNPSTRNNWYTYFNKYTGLVKIQKDSTNSIISELADAISAVYMRDKKTLKDSNNNSIPLTRSRTLANHVVEDMAIELKKNPTSALRDTLFAKNLKLIGQPQILLDASNYYGESKKIKDLTEAELNYVTFQQFLNGINTGDYLIQPAEYSDKPTIECYPIPLSKLVYKGRKFNFMTAPFNDGTSIDGTQNTGIKTVLRDTIGSFYQNALLNVVIDYSTIYFRNGKIDEKYINRLRQNYPEEDIDKWREAIEKELINSKQKKEDLQKEIEKLKALIKETSEDDVQLISGYKEDIKNKELAIYKSSRIGKIQDYELLLSVTTEQEFREMAWNNGKNTVDVVEEILFNKGNTFKTFNESGVEIDLPGLIPNKSLVYCASKMFRDDNIFNQHLELEYRKTVRDLINCNFTYRTIRFNGQKNDVFEDAVSKLYKDTLSKNSYMDNWVEFSELVIAKEISEVNGKKVSKNIRTIEDLNAAKNIKLNPILERYFLTRFVLQYNLLLITEGSEIGHAIKQSFKDPKYGFQEAILEISARNTAANKRHVDLGTPGTTSARNSIYGIPLQLRNAVVQDIKAPVFSINGETANVDACDGSVKLDPITARLFLNGLQDSRIGGETFKTMRSDRHSRYGTNSLWKDAEYPINNTTMRQNQTAEYGDYKLFQKMQDLEWDQEHDESDAIPKAIKKHGNYEIDITKNLFGNHVDIKKRFPNGLYFKQENKVYQLTDINKVSGKIYTVEYTQVEFDQNKNIVAKKTISVEKEINSNWDLYQVLGGCYTGRFNSTGKFVYNDDSLDALVSYVNNTGIAYNKDGGTQEKRNGDNLVIRDQNNTWQPLKNKMISSIAFMSAVKSGATNVNPHQKLKDTSRDVSSRLYTSLMSSKNWFVVQDYDHIVVDGESVLTEFSQVITSMSAGGYIHGTTEELFSALAQYSLSEAAELISSVKSYVESNFDPDSKSKLYHIIGSYLVKAVYKDNDSTNLISHLMAEVKNFFNKNNRDHTKDTTHINFSDPEIFAKAITNIASIVNKIVVKRKYPGGGMIMVPSYNMFMLHIFPGKHYHMTTNDILNHIYSAIKLDNSYVTTVVEKQDVYEKQDDGTEKINLNTKVKISKNITKLNITRDNEFEYVEDINWTNNNEAELYKESTIDEIKENLFINIMTYLSDIENNTKFVISKKSLLNPVLNILVSKNILTKQENGDFYIFTKIKTIDNVQAINSYVDFKDNEEHNYYKHPSEVSFYQDDELLSITGTKTISRDDIISKNLQFRIKPKNLFSIEELIPEDNIILADKDGNYLDKKGNVTINPVRINTSDISTFYDILELAEEKEIYFYRDLKTPRNLESAKIIITTKEGKKRSIYSLPAIKEAFKNLSKIENSGISSSAKKIQKLEHLRNIQKINQLLYMGYMPITEELPEDFIDLDKSDLVVKIESVDTGSYEAVLPSIFKEEFGIEEGDSLYDILNQGIDYFRNKWNKNHRTALVDHDLCFTRNNSKHTYVKFTLDKRRRRYPIDNYYIRINEKKGEKYVVDEEDNILYIYQKAKKIEKKVDDDIIYEFEKDESGNLIWEDNIVRLANNSGEEIYYCANEEAALDLYDPNEYDGIRIDKDVDDKTSAIIRNFIKNGASKEHKLAFTNKNQIQNYIDRNEISLDEGQDIIDVIPIEDLIDLVEKRFTPTDQDLATIFNSFKKSLEVIAARIPAQTLQSFMKMKVVAFTERATNTIMVSHYQLWLQGSDYDIDKAYVMSYEISKNGKILGWSPFFNLTSGTKTKLSFELPAPTMKDNQIDLVQGKVDITEELKAIDAHLKEVSKGVQLTDKAYIELLVNESNYGNLLHLIVPLLKKAKSYSLKYNVKEISSTKARLIINLIIKRHNKYFDNLSNVKYNSKLPKKKYITKAFKNIVARNIMYGTSHILNASLAQSPITMGDARVAANESALGKEDRENIHWSPTYIPKAQTDAMKGKSGIGVAANGEKVFFTLLHYFTKNLLSGDVNRIKKVVINKAFKFAEKTETKYLIANINLNCIEGISESKLLESRELLINCINELYFGNESLEDVASVIQDQLGFSYDQSLVISALLSAATDNAKELILGKINADPSFMNMYLYAVILGYDLVDISKFMTNPNISNIIKLHRADMFNEFNLLSSRHRIKLALSGVFSCPDNILWAVNMMSSFIDSNLKRKKINKILDVYEKEQNIILRSKYPEQNVNEINTQIEKMKSDLQASLNDNFSELLDYSFKYKISISDLITKQVINKFTERNDYVSEDIKAKIWNYRKTFELLINIRKEDNFEEDFAQFVDLQRGGEEISDIAKLLKINQGLGVTDVDKINNLSSIENIYSKYINPNFNQLSIDTIAKKVMQFNSNYDNAKLKNKIKEFKLHKELDLIRFLSDEEYKQLAIDIVGSLKHSFNPFDVITDVEHIKALYDVLYSVTIADKSMSDRMDKLIEAKKKLTQYNISKDQINLIKNLMNELLIYNFITRQGISIQIKPGQRYIKNKKLQTHGEIVEDNKKIIDDTIQPLKIDLNSEDGLASFKHWFENVFVKELQRDIELIGNEFIANIISDFESNKYTGKNRVIIGIDINFSNIDEEGFEKNRFNRIQHDFISLANIKRHGRSIVDWFYIYNLVVYKNVPGQQRMQPLFGPLLKNDNLLPSKYNRTIGYNDFFNISNIEEYSIDDLFELTAPVVMPHQGHIYNSRGVKFIRVYNEQEYCYDLYKIKYKKKKKEVDVEDYEEHDSEQNQQHQYVEGYKYVKSLNNPTVNNYYCFNLSNIIKSRNKFDFPEELTLENTLKVFNNLFSYNIVNVYINCD